MLINKKHVSIKIDDPERMERNKELSFILEISNFVAISRELELLLKGALHKVLNYFDIEAGRIYVLDEQESLFYLAAHEGMEPKGFEKLSFDEGFSGKAARTKSFLAKHVSEMENKKRAALLSKQGFKIVICVPLIAMDNVLGVMNLASRKIVSLDQDKIDLLIAIGNLIAIAANDARTYKELQDKITALNEKKDTIKFFVYSISHDLKSPVVGIHGMIKRLKEKHWDNLNESGKACCDQVMKASEQILELVEKLNAYIVTKESPLNIEMVNVKEITETIRDEFSEILSKRKIKWSEPDYIPEIAADKLSILRVFRNLVDNALKYGGDHMFEIRIGYEKNNNSHILSFSDDGIGIEEEDREKAFETFSRTGTSNGISGSGLGLAIVKEIADKHGGRAWISEPIEKRTTFFISIAKSLETID